MGAITGVVQFGPPIRWGNAAGKAIIAEVWKIPASTAGDTQTLTSTNISDYIGIVGILSATAVTNTESGVSVACTTLATVAASNFAFALLIGYARNAV